MTHDFRLSFQQRRRWRQAEKRGLERAVLALEIEGALSAQVLRETLETIARRHAALRTSYRRIQGLGAPVQHVASEPAIVWRKVDLGEQTSDDTDRELETLRQSLRAVVDVVDAPPLEAVLCKRSPDASVLMLALPGLSADHHSLRLVAREIATVLEGRASELEADPVQYPEYSTWQHSLLEDESSAPSLAFWRQQALDSAWDPPILEARDLERERPAQATWVEARSHLGDSTVIAAFDDLAESGKQDALVAAAWGTLWLRLAPSQGEVPFAFLDSDRHDEPALADVVGSMTTVLPLAFGPPLHGSFRDAVTHAMERLRDPRAHRAYTDAQVDSPKWTGITVGLEGLPETPWEGQSSDRFSCRLSILSPPDHPLETWLRWWRTEDGGITLCVNAAEGKVAKDLTRWLTHLLRDALQQPETPLRHLRLLEESDHRALSELANGPVAELPYRSALELFAECCEANPEAPAVIHEDTVPHEDAVWTYRELKSRADGIAEELRRRGASPEDRIALYLQPSPYMVAALLGALEAGCVFVPVDTTLPAKRAELLVERSGCRLVLVDAGSDWAGLPSIEIGPQGPKALGEDPAADSISSPERLAYVIHTSGSTGEPKGVMVTHGGLLNYLVWARDEYQAAQGEGSVLHTSVGVDLSLTSLLVPLCAGTAVTIVDDTVGLVERLRPGADYSLLKLTPSHLQWMLDHASTSTAQGPDGSLEGAARAYVIGGEALSQGTVEHLRSQDPETQLFNEYGPTETVVGCCCHRVGDTEKGPVVPIGRPIANTRIYVVDTLGRLAPPEIEGELWVGGSGVARGYLDAPSQTAESFVPDPFTDVPGARLYRTGDRARLRRDGLLSFIGRFDDQVKIRGFRVELEEVAATVRSHGAVGDAVATARQRDAGENELIVYFTGSVPSEALREYLSTLLPEAMVPSHLVALDALPLTRRGKVDHDALPNPRGERRISRPLVPPSGETEEALAEIWREILGISEIGMDDPFFELGGSSLLLVKARTRIEQRFGVALSIPEMLDLPTLRALNRRLSAESATEPPGEKALDAAADRARLRQQLGSRRGSRRRAASGEPEPS